MAKGMSRDKILTKLYELAFAPANDAVKLAYLEPGDPEETERLEKLDLRSLAGIHRLSNGSVELKLIDREKLIALLLQATAEEGAKGGMGSLIGALNNAAGKVYSAEAGTVDTFGDI